MSIYGKVSAISEVLNFYKNSGIVPGTCQRGVFMEAYSVLMTVWKNENPVFFETAVESMVAQTVRTDDFVIVCDGPLTAALDAVIEKFTQAYPELFHIVRLPENVGIGKANSFGLEYCKNDLVAKMDADDIAVHDRCQKQLELFRDNPQLMVAGGFIEEFDKDPANPFAVRSVPVDNDEIRKFARRRQPFNNMTVMYRRHAVVAAGGYRNYRRNEDYDLYLRMLHAGNYAQNLPEILVQARVNNGAYSRRASWATLDGCVRSRWYAYRIGYSSLLDFLICAIGELIIVVSPRKLQHFIYQRFLRKKSK